MARAGLTLRRLARRAREGDDGRGTASGAALRVVGGVVQELGLAVELRRAEDVVEVHGDVEEALVRAAHDGELEGYLNIS
ncbi:MAG TPA: hypothetical protein PK095_13445, partial [Myxococcota bacterium]|nr:hypothetical protein [Myxococcota bacterium]